VATGTEPPALDAGRQPATGVHSPTRAAVGARHLRTDRWWLAPAVTAAGLVAFVVYSTWRAFAAAGGPNWEILGSWWTLSPALIILVFPLGFRLTCYYYRKAYYRSFWASPPACAVAEPHRAYTGETRFPLILQNAHRYFFYAALPVAAILTYDTVLTFRDASYAWGHAGLGTLVFLANTVLIWAYTLSCHSCRHIVGGRLRHFSRHPVRYRLWTWTGRLNARHMQLAWASLISVALCDLYVYLLATGTFDDPRIF
jgi:hypothetical protein